VLVGYSFGADVLPAAYDRLAPDEKAKVSAVSLLALSDSATLRIRRLGLARHRRR